MVFLNRSKLNNGKCVDFNSLIYVFLHTQLKAIEPSLKKNHQENTNKNSKIK